MTPLYTPTSEPEAVVISSLLEAYGIPFFIRGGAFGKLCPGVHISPYSTQTFMVDAAKLAFARELIAEFTKDQAGTLSGEAGR